MNVLDLFSGIGGFSLGLERAGMRTVAFCEIDPYCRKVLAKHWPRIPIFGDIRSVRYEQDDWGPIDVICGGFPCQDISLAGKGAGITGERSGLWKEYARIIGEVRPRYVIVENVSALLSRGLGDVLGDLATLGYDAEWHCIPASAVGAPHRRDRIWIIAYRDADDKSQSIVPVNDETSGLQGDVGHAIKSGLEGHAEERAISRELGRLISRSDGSIGAASLCGQWDEGRWFAESGMGRISNGIPNRVDRLKALGNAVVPQIPEIIGRAIMKAALTSAQGKPE